MRDRPRSTCGPGCPASRRWTGPRGGGPGVPPPTSRPTSCPTRSACRRSGARSSSTCCGTAAWPPIPAPCWRRAAPRRRSPSWPGTLPRGARVAVEEPGYQRAAAALRGAGLAVLPVPVDGDGLVVDALPAGLAAVYCTPAHQFPLGARLSAARRVALVARARAEGFLVVEDDYDGELRYDVAPLPLLAALGPDVVVHLGTASKLLTPTLGVGWLVAPPAVSAVVVAQRDRAGVRPARAGQRVFAALAAHGDLGRHLRRLRRELAQRRRAVVAAVAAAGMPVCGDAAGAHVVVRLADAGRGGGGGRGGRRPRGRPRRTGPPPHRRADGGRARPRLRGPVPRGARPRAPGRHRGAARGRVTRPGGAQRAATCGRSDGGCAGSRSSAITSRPASSSIPDSFSGRRGGSSATPAAAAAPRSAARRGRAAADQRRPRGDEPPRAKVHERDGSAPGAEVEQRPPAEPPRARPARGRRARSAGSGSCRSVGVGADAACAPGAHDQSQAGAARPRSTWSRAAVDGRRRRGHGDHALAVAPRAAGVVGRRAAGRGPTAVTGPAADLDLARAGTSGGGDATV